MLDICIDWMHTAMTKYNFLYGVLFNKIVHIVRILMKAAGIYCLLPLRVISDLLFEEKNAVALFVERK